MSAVVHYSRGNYIEQESSYEIPDKKPRSDWPRDGDIEYKHVSMSYRPGLPKVLRDLSLHIKGGEKIGVVGRTGAGKSSLALTLLRLVDYSGSIIIDGYAIIPLLWTSIYYFVCLESISGRLDSRIYAPMFQSSPKM